MSERLSTGQSGGGRGTEKDATFITLKAGIFLEEDECSCLIIINWLEAGHLKKRSRYVLKYFRSPLLVLSRG
jgi:hypothetical protein